MAEKKQLKRLRGWVQFKQHYTKINAMIITCILRSNFSSTLSLLNCTPLSTFDVFCFCGMGAGAPSICISAKARLFCLKQTYVHI